MSGDYFTIFMFHGIKLEAVKCKQSREKGKLNFVFEDVIV